MRAFDENMNEFEMEGEGLLAKAFCHELDHLDGKLYVELAEDGLHEVSYDEEDQDDAQGGGRMRIIFMGTPDFSVGTLEALVEAGHDVCLAVTTA